MDSYGQAASAIACATARWESRIWTRPDTEILIPRFRPSIPDGSQSVHKPLDNGVIPAAVYCMHS